jgi:pyruvate kinase
LQIVPVRRDFRLTKIICTIGPASEATTMLEKLARAGMNVARINMSHGTREKHREIIRRIKNLNRKLNHPIAILMDLQGPEIRTGELKKNINLAVGEIFTFNILPEENPEERSVFVNYKGMVDQLKAGDRITVDNGLINLQVLEKSLTGLRCVVLEGGTLGSRKHINLPGVRVNLPSLAEKDKRDIEMALQEDLDFIALSFVRSADAVTEARAMVESSGGHTRIISKIENEEGVANFDSILAESDGIMVARGDLGVEVEIAELPVIQRMMVRKCCDAGKPVIVATHLLESMIQNPMPTRAEATDVANVVFEQADALMLSGETAVGKYPVKCIEVLDQIARRLEKEPGIGFALARPAGSFREQLARSACKLADSLKSPAIVVMTRRGILAEQVASFRPSTSIIYAFTNMSSSRRKLWLARGVVPFLMDFSNDPEKNIRAAFEKLRARNRVLTGDEIVVVSDVAAGSERFTSIQIRRLD